MEEAPVFLAHPWGQVNLVHGGFWGLAVSLEPDVLCPLSPSCVRVCLHTSVCAGEESTFLIIFHCQNESSQQAGMDKRFSGKQLGPFSKN